MSSLRNYRRNLLLELLFQPLCAYSSIEKMHGQEIYVALFSLAQQGTTYEETPLEVADESSPKDSFGLLLSRSVYIESRTSFALFSQCLARKKGTTSRGWFVRIIQICYIWWKIHGICLLSLSPVFFSIFIKHGITKNYASLWRPFITLAFPLPFTGCYHLSYLSLSFPHTNHYLRERKIWSLSSYYSPSSIQLSIPLSSSHIFHSLDSIFCLLVLVSNKGQ